MTTHPTLFHFYHSDMNVIIFSKDRPMQLDLLLRSMPEQLRDECTIIVKSSHTPYYIGYLEVVNKNDAWFCFESHFKTDLLESLSWYDPLTMFFTDDDVFINPMPEIPELPDAVACLSLRLNPSLDYCYTLCRSQNAPKMTQNGNNWVWNWRLADADFGYPMSLDGHIFRTADILPLLKRLDYHDPNSLEAALAENPIDRPLMMCYDKSIIVNNPINRVQDTVPNRHGNITAKELNNLWLAGKRIKLEPFMGIKNNACHMEIPLEFE